MAVTLSFDADREEDVRALPELAELLSSHGFKGSFACIGKWIERRPKEHRGLVEEGHEMVNHTYSHPNHELFSPNRYFNRLSHAEMVSEVERFERVARKLLGVKPVGFRAPHFGSLHTNEVYPLLAERGYLYSSSVSWVQGRSAGRPFRQAGGVLELPVVTCPAHYFPVFDSVHALRTEPLAHRPEEFPHLFERAVRMAEAHGAYANFYFDPADVANWKPFEQALEWLHQNQKSIWVARSEEVARYWCGFSP